MGGRLALEPEGAAQESIPQQIGLDAYMRLLRKTVERIQKGEEVTEWPDPDVSLEGAAYLPDSYVSDSSQKLHLYRRLSKVGSRTEIEALKLELADRFGPLPAEAERLLDSATLRVLGRAIGVEQVLIRGRSARISFRQDVVPKMGVLEGPLRQRQAYMEIRRVHPLSVQLEQDGVDPILETVTVALAALTSARSAAA